MHVYQVIRTASKRAGMSLIEIGPKLGHGKAYVSSMITTGRTPKVDTLARILGACGYELCAVPKGKAPKSGLVIEP